MYYLYLMRNKKTYKLYIGYTNNLRRRLREYGKDWELVYYEAYKSEKGARERERKLKQRGQSIRWLKGRLKNSLEK